MQAHPFLSEESQEIWAFFAPEGEGEGRGSVRNCGGARQQERVSLREMFLEMPPTWHPQKGPCVSYDENENTIDLEFFSPYYFCDAAV